MKKIYQNPETIVAEMTQSQMIASTVSKIAGNAGFSYGGGKGNVSARTKEQTWDDWSEE